MEPTNKPPVSKAKPGKGGPDLEFLPDADSLERSPLPPFLRITPMVLAGALLTFLVWSSVSEMDEIVTARGRLVTDNPNIVLQPIETAIIQHINVRVGQVVKKGDLLATLDPTFAKADEDQLRSRLNSLATQQRELEAELAGKTPDRLARDSDSLLQANLAGERKLNYQSQAVRLRETVAKLRATLETNRRDQTTLANRVKALREIEAMQEKLVAQQYGARLQLLQAQDNRLSVERELDLTVNREHEIARDLAVAEADLSAFGNNWRQKTMEELLSTSRESATLREQLNKADKRREHIQLIAPADGVVLDIAKLSPGSVVKEAEAFFTLVPLGGKLEAEVRLDALDVGHVKPGAGAHLKFDAFPYQKHGGLEGKVRVISGDAFRREGGSGGPDAYYLALVDVSAGRLKGMKAEDRLLPGMTMAAEIVVGKRTVLSYLLWPLSKAMDESLREP